jgi:hypothetical protein
MAQPSPAFPDLQMFSRLIRALPQLFVPYLLRPENSQYFPLYSLPGPARKFSKFSSLFVILSGQKIVIFFFITYLF